MSKQTGIAVLIALMLIAIAALQLTHAQPEPVVSWNIEANHLIHQPRSLPPFRRFLRTAAATQHDSLLRIAVFSTSKRSDSLTHCVVYALRSLFNDPRLNMRADWSNNWEVNRVLRRKGIFNRPAGIFKDTSGNTAIQYREAWVKFSLHAYDQPWQLTIFEKNNPAASDFIFSRDTTVLHSIHEENNFGWKQLNYISLRRQCALVLASEASPEIGSIQPEPVHGISTWMVHTPDMQSSGWRDETKQQLNLLRPRCCIFAIDAADHHGLFQVQKMLRLIGSDVPVIVVSTGNQQPATMPRVSYLYADAHTQPMVEVLRGMLMINPQGEIAPDRMAIRTSSR